MKTFYFLTAAFALLSLLEIPKPEARIQKPKKLTGLLVRGLILILTLTVLLAISSGWRKFFPAVSELRYALLLIPMLWFSGRTAYGISYFVMLFAAWVFLDASPWPQAFFGVLGLGIGSAVLEGLIQGLRFRLHFFSPPKLLGGTVFLLYSSAVILLIFSCFLKVSS